MTARIAIPARPGAGLTVALCCLAALAEGFDIQSMGVAAPTLAPALRLTRDQLGPVFSASTLGLLVGAIVLGRLADRVGRRWTLIASLAIYGVFSLATAWAWDFTSLAVIRVLAGVGLGGAMPNMIALAAEAVAEARRARFVAVMAATMPFGGVVASLAAASLDWRSIFVVGGLWPLAVAVLMLVLLPESHRFVAARQAQAEGAASAPSYAHVLFGGGRAAATLSLWIAAFAMLLQLYLILNWLPTLMGAKGVSKPDAAWVQVLFNLGGGLGGLAIAALFSGARRAATFAVWFVGMAVGVVLLSQAQPTLMVSGLAGLAAGLFIPSAPTAIYALAPDYYGVAMRGTGVGAVIGMGRLGAIAGPILAAALLASGQGVAGVLLGLLPFVALAAAATFAALWRRPASQVSPAAA